MNEGEALSRYIVESLKREPGAWGMMNRGLRTTHQPSLILGALGGSVGLF